MWWHLVVWRFIKWFTTLSQLHCSLVFRWIFPFHPKVKCFLNGTPRRLASFSSRVLPTPKFSKMGPTELPFLFILLRDHQVLQPKLTSSGIWTSSARLRAQADSTSSLKINKNFTDNNIVTMIEIPNQKISISYKTDIRIEKTLMSFSVWDKVFCFYSNFQTMVLEESRTAYTERTPLQKNLLMVHLLKQYQIILCL